MNAWRTQFIALCLALLLGSVYIATMAPGAVWGDGLEFATVVHTLGVPHPTGYPLYVMLGRAWELAVPLGDVALRLNLLSALFGVGAALLLFGAVWEAMPEEREWEDVAAPHHWRRVLIPAGTALAWGLTPAVWQVSNVAEVYTLFAVFLHGLVWLMLRNLRRPLPFGDVLVALVFGLSLTHHRLIVVLLPAVAVYLLIRVMRVWRETRQRWIVGEASVSPGTRVLLWTLGCGAAFAIGLLPILYLPLRAAAEPAINWGDPSSPDRLLWVLRGGAYMKTRLLADAGGAWPADEIAARAGARINLALTLLLGEFVPMMTRSPAFARISALVLLTLMGLGWWRSRLSLRWGVPATAGITLLLIGVYNIADFQAYLIPVISAAWFWLAFGVLWVAEWFEAVFLRRRFTYTALVLGLLPLWLVVQFWSICDRSHEERADLWARRVLDQVEEGALVMTHSDGDTYAMWYAQHVDGLRPDVTVYGVNFMWTTGYRGFFTDEEAGDLYFEPIDAPTDPRYFLNALIGGVVAPNLAAGRPVYTCFNIYESINHLFLTIWENTLYGDLKYTIMILDDQTRDPNHRGVGPPPNPLLRPHELAGLGARGEPTPLLFRLVDNPPLTELALRRFEEEVTQGHEAWQRSHRDQVFGRVLERPSEALGRSGPQ